MSVVDYVSSRISAKVSCSLARPSPDSSSVCTRTLRDCFLLHTSIIAENKNIILYLYIHTCSLFTDFDYVLYYNRKVLFTLSAGTIEYVDCASAGDKAPTISFEGDDCDRFKPSKCRLGNMYLVWGRVISTLCIHMRNPVYSLSPVLWTTNAGLFFEQKTRRLLPYI